MATSPLTQAHLQAVADALRAHGGSVTDASASMGIHRGTFTHQVREAIRARKISETELAELRDAAKKAKRLPPERESLHSGRRLPQTADECWALLDDFIGRTSKGNGPNAKQPGRLVKKTQQPDTRRVVVAGDFHAPFTDMRAVAEMIRREQGADLLIVNGDLQDFYAVSKYIKYERVSIESELAAVDALLGQLSRAFPEVVIVAGNHDHQRFEKQLRDRLSVEMVHVVEFLTGGNLSVIRLIAQRYPNIRLASTPVGRHTVGWFHQEGDLLCTHAETFSAVEGSTLRRLASRMDRMAPTFGLEEWRVCIQAHTHQFGILKVGHKLMVEGGCMADVPGYALTASAGASPQTNGWVTLTQTRGRTDWNSVRFVHAGELPERENVA